MSSLADWKKEEDEEKKTECFRIKTFSVLLVPKWRRRILLRHVIKWNDRSCTHCICVFCVWVEKVNNDHDSTSKQQIYDIEYKQLNTTNHMKRIQINVGEI